MSKIDIRAELKTAIRNSKWDQYEVADKLFMAKSNITNWISYGRPEIPVDKLLMIVKFLDNDHFRYVVADYLLDLKVLMQESKYIENPAGRFLSAKKEVSQVLDLDESFSMVIVTKPEERTPEDKAAVLKYLKEVDEAISAYVELKTSIIDDWELYDRKGI